MDSVFLPTPGSPVLLLDQAVREDLALSLQRIAERAASVLPAAVDPEEMCRRIRSHRIAPGVFAAYYELVYALQDRRWGSAAKLWLTIAQRVTQAVEPAIVAYEPAQLGEDADRFQRLLTRGWGQQCLFAPPDGSGWELFRADYEAALELLEAVYPAWRQEVDSLITRVFAALPPNEQGRQFAGASSFLVWGAVFLNVRRHNDRLRMLAGLVHEATHQMLFGLSRCQPLTENDPAARYPSPLRRDPRPMDGVYHATYVSGRLAALYERLSAHDALSVEERHTAGERFQRQRERFHEGHAVLRADGKLSDLGRTLIESALAGVPAVRS